MQKAKSESRNWVACWNLACALDKALETAYLRCFARRAAYGAARHARCRVIGGSVSMNKIGILCGQEHSFPPAFVERVNQKTGGKQICAEFVRIDKVLQAEPCGYDVVIDRISQDVPFYRAWLKNAALTGTAVVNNPFWWSADEKFFNNALA